MTPAAAAAILGLTAITALQAPSTGPPLFPGGTRLIRLDVSVVRDHRCRVVAPSQLLTALPRAM